MKKFLIVLFIATVTVLLISLTIPKILNDHPALGFKINSRIGLDIKSYLEICGEYSSAEVGFADLTNESCQVLLENGLRQLFPQAQVRL